MLFLSFILIAGTTHAQDSIAKAKINWIIGLARLNNPRSIIEEIEAKKFKAISKKEDSTGVIIIYRNQMHEDCGLMIENNLKVTAVFYETKSIELYNQAVALITEMGFKTYPAYKSGPDENAYLKDNDLFVIKTNVSTKDYTFAASLLIR